MFDSSPADAPEGVVDVEPPLPTQRLPRIRHAIESDGNDLMALEQRVFARARFSKRQWRNHLDSDSAIVLVARQDRRVAGSLVFFFRRGSSLARIAQLAVDAPLRGRGIASALLEAAEQLAAKRGIQRIRFDLEGDNVAALKLCRRFGYQADRNRATRFEKSLR